ncbi:MAG: hypothetical protein KJZ62_07600 [Fimbriimonadaceae bacterium]|nr:hypothetical protein [Fimbriimonadaceae bacterium]QOJ12335.1 MAG: hypothetical protein HRU74_09825 [Chthonomonadaceae bacterium]
MRRFAVAVLVAVSGLWGCGSTGSDAPQPESKVVSIDLPAGAEVELLLLTKLEAGQAKKGDEVPFLVARDVLDPAGNVAIERGAVVRGIVEGSRSEGTLSSMLNQPARLSVAIRPLALENGLSAGLASRSDDESDTIIEFTRENTTPKKLNSEDRIDTDAEAKLLAEALERAFNGEELTEAMTEVDKDQLLRDIASRYGLTETKAYVEGPRGSVSLLSETLRSLQRGNVTSLSGGEVALAVAAISELADFAGSVGSRLSRSLKGRTIRAYPGTRVKVYTTTKITFQRESQNQTG